MRPVGALVASVVLCGVLAACSGSANDRSVLVMAASSLSQVFLEMEAVFEEQNPGVDVVLNFGGSAALREQILEGAPADVFAAANRTTMAAVVDAGAAESPIMFATNELALAVPAGNPAGIESIADLGRDELLVGLCAVGVPCGDFARDALGQVGVTASADTDEKDVRSLLTKIEFGELDVGIVYITDVASTEKVDAIALPANANVAIEYPIAVLDEAPNGGDAERFVDFVRSAEGARILVANGFGTP